MLHERPRVASALGPITVVDRGVGPTGHAEAANPANGIGTMRAQSLGNVQGVRRTTRADAEILLWVRRAADEASRPPR